MQVKLMLAVAVAALTMPAVGAAAALRDLCVEREFDTHDNCACGQNTADNIMEPQEQTLLLGIMRQDPAAQQQLMQLGAGLVDFRRKMETVTSGCPVKDSVLPGAGTGAGLAVPPGLPDPAAVRAPVGSPVSSPVTADAGLGVSGDAGEPARGGTVDQYQADAHQRKSGSEQRPDVVVEQQPSGQDA